MHAFCTLRQATLADASAISEVQVATWKTAYAGVLSARILDAMCVDERTDRWRTILDVTTWPVFVAEHDDDVVGFGSCLPCRDADIAGSTTSELAALYVLEPVARLRIGSRLLTRCAADAHERGFDAMTLWVLARNAPAHAFYQRAGFALDGAVKHDARLDAEERRMRASLPLATAGVS